MSQDRQKIFNLMSDNSFAGYQLSGIEAEQAHLKSQEKTQYIAGFSSVTALGEGGNIQAMNQEINTLQAQNERAYSSGLIDAEEFSKRSEDLKKEQDTASYKVMEFNLRQRN